MKKIQSVQIKGTKEGLMLFLDDLCSYEDLKNELERKLSENTQLNEDHHVISVKVHIGNRFLTADQLEEIKAIVHHKKNLAVEAIESNVMSKGEAHRIIAENNIVSVARIVRSGQVLEVPGDLLLIGDVNPGGMVIAGGNIFIMGTLKGIAHAGAYGDSTAVISASIMMPTQLRINQCLSRAPDRIEGEEKRIVECAYIDEHNQIVIGRIEELMHLRPNLKRLEGGF